MNNYNEYQKEISKIALKAVADGLIKTIGGNISLKIDDNLYLITATGAALDELDESNILLIDDQGLPLEKTEHKPSQETGMHLAIYKNRQDIRAIVHLHPLVSTTLISLEEDISFATFEQEYFLKNGYKIIPPLPAGSEDLKVSTSLEIKFCEILILKFHGVISIGGNLKEAYYRIVELETAAQASLISKLLDKKILLPKFS